MSKPASTRLMSDIEQIYNIVGENESVFDRPDAEYFIRQAKRNDL